MLRDTLIPLYLLSSVKSSILRKPEVTPLRFAQVSANMVASSASFELAMHLPGPTCTVTLQVPSVTRGGGLVPALTSGGGLPASEGNSGEQIVLLLARTLAIALRQSSLRGAGSL